MATGGPFEFQVALHNLTLGTLGLLCFWVRGTFGSATVIALQYLDLEPHVATFAIFSFAKIIRLVTQELASL